MKQLTKEQLIDLIFDNCKKVTELNSEGLGERVSDYIENENDFTIAIIKAMAAYGAEIKKECCNILAETLYDVFSANDLEFERSIISK